MVWPVPANTTLTGENVELAPIDPEADAAPLFQALNDDRIWALSTIARPATASDYRAILHDFQTQASRWHWTVRTRTALAGLAPGTVAGTTSYCDATPHDARLEIGYTQYDPAVWGSVVNPECKLLLLTHAFEVMGTGRVQFKCDIRNVRSQQAIARIGANYEGTLRRYQRRADGTVRDTLLFSITAEEWPMVRARLLARLGY